MIRFFTTIIFTAAFLIPQASFDGKTVAVLDGDTIEVMRDGRALRIRLNGIDCPEKNQAFGMKAKQFTSAMIYGKLVTVKEKEIDRYGRTIADIYLQDGTWLNKALIDAGFAWHYKAFSNDKVLANAEIKARRDSIGLWSDPSPVAPWLFRRK